MLGGDGGASSVAVPGCAWPQGQCFCLADIPAQQAPGGSGGIFSTKRSWPADGAAVIQTGVSASKCRPGAAGIHKPQHIRSC